MSDIKFTPIKIKDFNIVLPEGYTRMFSDMESLKSFMIARLSQEAEMLIRSAIVKQMKDLEFYES